MKALSLSLEGEAKILDFLLSKSGDPNKEAALGNTPLGLAAFNGRKECVKVLLKHGADTQTLNDFGKTCLDLAKERGHEEIVKLLSTKISG